MRRKADQIIRYKVIAHPELSRNSLIKAGGIANIRKKIDCIINYKKGWRAYYSIYFKSVSYNPQLKIILTPHQNILNHCGGVPNLKKDNLKLSCYDSNNKTIFLHWDRWVGGSRPSGMNLKDYRHYLINHEVGHFLGYKHPITHHSFNKNSQNYNKYCINGYTPVMYQQTLGKLNGCKPNPFPRGAAGEVPSPSNSQSKALAI